MPDANMLLPCGLITSFTHPDEQCRRYVATSSTRWDLGVKGTTPTPMPAMAEAARLERGLALMGETDILPLVSHVTPEFVSHLTAASLVSSQKALIAPFRAEGSNLEALATRPIDVKRVPTELYGLALARQRWSRSPALVYFDRPNILSYHRRLRHDRQGKFLVSSGFDIVVNDVAVGAGSDNDRFHARLEQGVLDTNAEAAIARMCAGERAAAECGDVQNTSEIFAMEREDSPSWITARSKNQPEWATTTLPNDVRARIENDLGDGYVVVVPDMLRAAGGQPFVAWWRVDPRTGTTLGIGERGWGQTAVEMDAMITFVAVGAICVAASLVNVEAQPGHDRDESLPVDQVHADCGSRRAWRRRGRRVGAAAGIKGLAALIAAVLSAVRTGLSMNPDFRGRTIRDR